MNHSLPAPSDNLGLIYWTISAYNSHSKIPTPGTTDKMGKYSLLLVLAASLLLTGRAIPASAEEEKPKAEKPQLTGNWKVDSATLEGQAFPESVTATMTLSMRGGRYQAHVGGQADRGSYRANDATSPMQMDITGIEGVNKGKTFLAIYDWQEEKLRICYSLEEGTRPTKFDSAKPGHFLVVYKREKK